MKTPFVSSVLALAAASLFSACSTEYVATEPGPGLAEFGSAEAAVSSCIGDDLQYDFNAFAASLSVAIGKELGRWDVMSDFVISNGKLALSSTGQTLCAAGCPNVAAILMLQEDVTADVTNHSPSVFRAKLTEWYGTQKQKLVEMATASLLAPGTYRIFSRGNNVRLSVAPTATLSGTAVGTYVTTTGGGADEWRAEVNGDRHKFINSKTGLCLDMASDSSADGVLFQQKTCAAASTTQRFKIEIVDNGFVAIRTKYSKTLGLKNDSATSGDPTTQKTYNQFNPYLHWKIATSSGASAVTSLITNGMYTFKARHNTSDKMIAVENGSTADAALARQYTYSEQDKFHWYVSRVGSQYQLINRRSGKCLALLTDSPSASAVGQKTCAPVSTQLFTFERRGDSGERYFSIKGPYNKYLEVKNANTADGTELILNANAPQDYHRSFYFAPIMAGEPHRLNYTRETPDAPCGVYKWYTITQPNGLPLTAPADAFVQLIFAGGKTTPNGADVNPFISQQTTDTEIAVDPSGNLNGSSASNSGSCIESDILFDTTGAALGTCCLRYNGLVGAFKKTAWNPHMYLCQ